MQNNIIKFKSFDKFSWLVHGISTKIYGNLKLKNNWEFISIDNNLDNFCKDLSIPPKDLVMMKQIHGSRVEEVEKKDKGKIIDNVDGLITKETGVYLGVNTADCVPIFFIDPNQKIVSIVHAGWKGTIEQIAKNALCEMVSKGGDLKNILTGIGPCIGKCCYKVTKERFLFFIEKFGKDKECIEEKTDGFYLDLGAINVKIMLDCGLKKDNIEYLKICNSCDRDLYFSFRKDKKDKYGEMLGILGMKDDQ